MLPPPRPPARKGGARMLALAVLVGLAVVVGLGWMSLYNGLVTKRNALQERVRADRRAAEAPLRPHPEPRRDREGLPEARARHARGGDRGAERRAGRGAARAAASPGDAAAMQGLSAAEGVLAGSHVAPARGRRGLPGPQGEPDDVAAHGGALLHREPDRLRAAGLQRRGDDLQQRARDLPRHARRGRLRRRRSSSRSRRRPSASR